MFLGLLGPKKTKRKRRGDGGGGGGIGSDGQQKEDEVDERSTRGRRTTRSIDRSHGCACSSFFLSPVFFLSLASSLLQALGTSRTHLDVHRWGDGGLGLHAEKRKEEEERGEKKSKRRCNRGKKKSERESRGQNDELSERALSSCFFLAFLSLAFRRSSSSSNAAPAPLWWPPPVLRARVRRDCRAQGERGQGGEGGKGKGKRRR